MIHNLKKATFQYEDVEIYESPASKFMGGGGGGGGGGKGSKSGGKSGLGGTRGGGGRQRRQRRWQRWRQRRRWHRAPDCNYQYQGWRALTAVKSWVKSLADVLFQPPFYLTSAFEIHPKVSSVLQQIIRIPHRYAFAYW